MRASVAAALLVLCLSTGAGQAADGFTGQGFLDTDQRFAEGYAFAVLDHQITVLGAGNVFSAQQLRYRECFIGTDFNSSNLYDAVLRHIKANPQTLLQPALGAVFGTLSEICPLNP